MQNIWTILVLNKKKLKKGFKNLFTKLVAKIEHAKLASTTKNIKVYAYTYTSLIIQSKQNKNLRNILFKKK